MENKLYFFAAWAPKKENTWSGTTWGIFTALKNFYTVIDKDINVANRGLVWRVLRKLKFVSNDLWYNKILKQRKLAERIIHETNETVKLLQFAEILQDTPSRKTYLYIDMPVSFLAYQKEYCQSEFKWQSYGIPEVSKKNIQRRAKLQMDYMKNSTAIFCMGRWIKDFLLQMELPETKVIHVGGGINVNLDLIKPNRYGNKKILFVGKDFSRKGGFITYEAFKILRERKMDVELYVAGPSIDPIHDPVDGYNYVGVLDSTEVAKMYNKCDVFCMPSYFEAYGLVFIEALTYGLPCIGRNCYEMPYFIEEGKTGLLLKEDNAEQLADLLQEVIYDEKYEKNVLERRDYYIKEYSWDTVAKRMKEVIDRT